MRRAIGSVLGIFVATGCSASGGDPVPSMGSGGSGGLQFATGGAQAATGGTVSNGTGGLPLMEIPQGGKSGSGGADGGNCGSVAIPSETTVTAGNVLVLFDQSLTMGEQWRDAAGVAQPKWTVAKDAIKAATTPLLDKLNIGAVFFPTTAGTDLPVLCNAAVAPASSAPQISVKPGGAFLSEWDQHFVTPPFFLLLGTPLNRALDHARTALEAIPGGSALVIITDGQWTCVDNTEEANVKALFQRGTKTYIVGLPGSYGTAGLDMLAAAGGTAKAGCTSNCYLLPSDGKELVDALSTIVTTTVTVSSCVLTLDPPPPDPKQVHLIGKEMQSGNEFEVLRSEPSSDGWNLSADGKVATMTGAVCDAAKSGALRDLHFEYGCVVRPPYRPPR